MKAKYATRHGLSSGGVGSSKARQQFRSTFQSRYVANGATWKVDINRRPIGNCAPANERLHPVRVCDIIEGSKLPGFDCSMTLQTRTEAAVHSIARATLTWRVNVNGRPIGNCIMIYRMAVLPMYCDGTEGFVTGS